MISFSEPSKIRTPAPVLELVARLPAALLVRARALSPVPLVVLLAILRPLRLLRLSS